MQPPIPHPPFQLSSPHFPFLWIFGFRVSGFGFWVLGFGFRDWDAVQADCQTALQLDKDSVKGHYMLGLVLLHRKIYEEAVREMGKVGWGVGGPSEFVQRMSGGRVEGSARFFGVIICVYYQCLYKFNTYSTLKVVDLTF